MLKKAINKLNNIYYQIKKNKKKLTSEQKTELNILKIMIKYIFEEEKDNNGTI